MKSSIIRDATPCNTMKVNTQFGETYLHLQGLRVNQAGNKICIHRCENLNSYTIPLVCGE
jgi:hypothetical protein